MTPEGETLYNGDGTINEHKLRILSRTYPQAVAGTIQSYNFDIHSANFTLKFTPKSALPEGDRFSASSIIYFNRELYYQHGVHVSITSLPPPSSSASAVESANQQIQQLSLLSNDELSFSVTCVDNNILEIVQLVSLTNDVKIDLMPCTTRQQDCTCR